MAQQLIIDGEYTIQLKDGNSTLVFSYIGYKTIEKTTSGNNAINIQMKTNSETLEEAYITTGIRSSQLKAERDKDNATELIESITPEDIGGFSYSNVADALQRVAGVQIERNDDGVSGDRVSIRGMGPTILMP